MTIIITLASIFWGATAHAASAFTFTYPTGVTGLNAQIVTNADLSLTITNPKLRNSTTFYALTGNPTNARATANGLCSDFLRPLVTYTVATGTTYMQLFILSASGASVSYTRGYATLTSVTCK